MYTAACLAAVSTPRLVWKGLDVGGSDLEDPLVVRLVVADDVLPSQAANGGLMMV